MNPVYQHRIFKQGKVVPSHDDEYSWNCGCTLYAGDEFRPYNTVVKEVDFESSKLKQLADDGETVIELDIKQIPDKDI